MAELHRLLESAPAPGRGYADVPPQPTHHMALVTCMDCRLDPAALLGLQIGDAHVLRNAGGMVTDDVLRSLAISQRRLGTRRVLVVQHTNCGMQGFDDDEFRRELADESGTAPAWAVPGFTDVVEQIRESVRAVRECSWLPYRDDVAGAVFDIATGGLTAVD